jgi:hypothetical protein
MTVLFTPISILMSDGVKLRRGFSADPAGIITTTGEMDVARLKGLKLVKIKAPVAAPMVRISATMARILLLFFLFFLGNYKTPGSQTVSETRFLPIPFKYEGDGRSGRDLLPHC